MKTTKTTKTTKATKLVKITGVSITRTDYGHYRIVLVGPLSFKRLVFDLSHLSGLQDITDVLALKDTKIPWDIDARAFRRILKERAKPMLPSQGIRVDQTPLNQSYLYPTSYPDQNPQWTTVL